MKTRRCRADDHRPSWKHHSGEAVSFDRRPQFVGCPIRFADCRHSEPCQQSLAVGDKLCGRCIEARAIATSAACSERGDKRWRRRDQLENYVSRPQARESSLHVVEQRIERTIVGGDILAWRSYLTRQPRCGSSAASTMKSSDNPWAWTSQSSAASTQFAALSISFKRSCRALVADKLHRIAAYATAVFMDLVILHGDHFNVVLFQKPPGLLCGGVHDHPAGLMVIALVG